MQVETITINRQQLATRIALRLPLFRPPSLQLVGIIKLKVEIVMKKKTLLLLTRNQN